MTRYIFHNSDCHLKVWILLLVTTFCQWFSFKCYIHSFFRKYLPYTHMWKTIVGQLFFQLNGVPWKKMATSAHKSQSHRYFSSRINKRTLECRWNALCPAHVDKQNIKNILKNQDLIKLIILIDSPRGLLKTSFVYSCFWST